MSDTIRVELTAPELAEVLRWTDVDLDHGFSLRMTDDRRRASMTALAKLMRAQAGLTGAPLPSIRLGAGDVDVFVNLLDPPPVKAAKKDTPPKAARARRPSRRRRSRAPRPATAAPHTDPLEILDGTPDPADALFEGRES